MTGDIAPFRTLMESDGQSEAAIRAFESAYAQLTSGQATMIPENGIIPASKLPELDGLKASSQLTEEDGGALLDATVVIKLNGGLGTGMGLEKAKSLLPVRSGSTFLDLIARQILHLRETHAKPLRFLLMSSFATRDDTAVALSPYADLGDTESLQFIQSRIPKIDAATLAPAICEKQPDLGWCPPGHGDLYPSLFGSGHLDQLLEAGVHLGHKTLRWNPKMKKFIFGEKNSIHIIDLTQTVDFIKNALIQVHKVVASGGKILVVSTKKQASEQVSELAKETGQYYVNYRWLGGMLTNWNTIQNSIKRLKKLDDQLSKENLGFTKKEILKFGKEKEKLHRSLGGISEMKKTPDLIFIIDTNIESLAVAEAKKLRIPIIAVLDTNSDPTGIDFPIPGNDDARRSIDLYCNLIKDTIITAKKSAPSQEINKINEKIGVLFFGQNLFFVGFEASNTP